MEQHQRDGLTHIGLALAIIGMTSTGIFQKLNLWIMLISGVAFVLFGLWEFFFGSSKIDRKVKLVLFFLLIVLIVIIGTILKVLNLT